MIQFLVHNATGTVGVVVVENVKANQPLTGWLMREFVLTKLYRSA